MPVTYVLEKWPDYPSGFADQKQDFMRQRVYLLPTRQGFIYGLMLFLMLLGAINYNNNMAFVLCFLLVGLGMICMLHTHRNLSRLIIIPKQPDAVFAGQQAYFPFLLDNRLANARISLHIAMRVPGKKWFTGNTQTHRISIKKHQQTLFQYPVQTKYRGLLKAERFVISSEYPLGLFRTWSYFYSDRECSVYPLPAGKDSLPQSIADDEQAIIGMKNGTDDFIGFRKYHTGDPVNLIDWKAFAKERGLILKQFSGRGSEVIMLDWRSVSHLQYDEERLSQLCRWVLSAHLASKRYGLCIPGVNIAPSFGEQHKKNCLEALARYGIGKASTISR